MTTARFRRLFCRCSIVVLAGCSGEDEADRCELEDADGIIGGSYTFALRVDDRTFDPIILRGQNRAKVTLTLTNQGTAPAGFGIDCLPTPNSDGCATESCFPESHTIAPIAAGASETVEFEIPEVEGIYTYRALAGDGARTGQFIVQ
jgi:hypothetical protein